MTVIKALSHGLHKIPRAPVAWAVFIVEAKVSEIFTVCACQ